MNESLDYKSNETGTTAERHKKKAKTKKQKKKKTQRGKVTQIKKVQHKKCHWENRSLRKVAEEKCQMAMAMASVDHRVE